MSHLPESSLANVPGTARPLRRQNAGSAAPPARKPVIARSSLITSHDRAKTRVSPPQEKGIPRRAAEAQRGAEKEQRGFSPETRRPQSPTQVFPLRSSAPRRLCAKCFPDLLCGGGGKHLLPLQDNLKMRTKDGHERHLLPSAFAYGRRALAARRAWWRARSGSVSHRRTVVSPEPEARVLPSGLKASDHT